ncbi:DAK2 domain-containing protein [Humidisolicoccus flavus]|uniref:DAK2 domain-containing protein n=1 Tax=Humidisolicoccus flavus TaxID=3111414 RepID=UPI003D2FE319
MAGVSLTLLWLDAELEELWTAPADSPAFRRGAVEGQVALSDAELAQEAEAVAVIPKASAASREAGAAIAAGLAKVARMLDEQADELGRIDRIAGDGDHGIGMQRGSKAGSAGAAQAAGGGAGARTVLEFAGDAWGNRGGGTSGAIWGEMLIALGKSLGDDREITADDVANGVTSAKDAVMSFGKAKVGDKTMVDAIVPFADTLAARVAAGDGLVEAWSAAADASQAAATATADITARLGRARSHGEKSKGTPDPGAISFALVVATVLDELKGK